MGGDWWGAIKAGLKMIGNSWKDAYSTPERGVLTTMSMIPIVGVEANAARAEYNLTRTVEGNLASRPYLNSPLTMGEIRATGRGVPDPGGIPGALRYDVPGSFNGSQGTYELVVHPDTNTVYHFLFRGN